MNKKSKESGFTLIEILIAITLFAFIGLAVGNALVEGAKLGKKLNVDGDFYNEVRTSFNLLGNDLTNLFSPELVLPQGWKPADAAQLVQLAATLEGMETRSSHYWEPVLHSSGVRPSRFNGDEKSLSFISVSHDRIYRDAPESLFTKIKYELRDDKTPDEGLEGTKELVKISDTNAFGIEDSRETTQKTFRYLGGIKSFKLRYYLHEKESWHNSWDSDSSEFKNMLPDLIEITVEVSKNKTQSFEGRYLFRREIPVYGIETTF